MKLFLSMIQFVQKSFALWVVLFAGIALYLPQGFVWLTHYIPLMLGVIMFGMGMTMTVDDLKVWRTTQSGADWCGCTFYGDAESGVCAVQAVSVTA
jgi:predicted Na+-dependent transporter